MEKNGLLYRHKQTNNSDIKANLLKSGDAKPRVYGSENNFGTMTAGCHISTASVIAEM